MVQTLYDVLDHEEDRDDFREFLKKKRAEELIDFFEVFRDYAASAPAFTAVERRRAAFRVYDTYLVDGARRSVNLGERSAEIRDRVQASFCRGDFAPEVLEEAVDSCLLLVAVAELHAFARRQRSRYGDAEPADAEEAFDETRLSLQNVTRANLIQTLEDCAQPSF